MIGSESLQIDVTLAVALVPVDQQRLRGAIRRVLDDAGITSGEIGVAVVDDDAIRRLNRQHLGHDYATDVLSFVLAAAPGRVEGQIAVSAETACREAACFGWPSGDELLLYVVHGTLHLAGYDDDSPAAAGIMRSREREVLSQFGLVPPWDEDDAKSGGPRCKTAVEKTGAAALPAGKGERK